MKRRIVATTGCGYDCMNPRKSEYFQYLSDHIHNVYQSWSQFLRPAMVEDGYDVNLLSEVDELIRDHDLSKYSAPEFEAYCNHWYPTEECLNDESAYDMAWLSHIHHNPHHPQHWVLLQDEGESRPLPMPLKYICEMLCDWHSFSAEDSESTAANWYHGDGSKLPFHEDTRNMIDKLIKHLDTPLKPPEVS